ncbi:hypothetical protein PIROE2DRAFT_3031, partial [Piromyces sp. E2]
ELYGHTQIKLRPDALDLTSLRSYNISNTPLIINPNYIITRTNITTSTSDITATVLETLNSTVKETPTITI